MTKKRPRVDKQQRKREQRQKRLTWPPRDWARVADDRTRAAEADAELIRRTAIVAARQAIPLAPERTIDSSFRCSAISLKSPKVA